MNLKNYTSTVPVERSAALIEKLLIDAGALHINKSYNQETKELEAFIFQILVNNTPIFFKLPINLEPIYNYMVKGRRLNKTQLENMKQQAKRTAWKMLYEYIQIKISYVMAEQVDLVQEFLSYACDPKTSVTYYQKLKDGGFKSLTQ